MWCEKTAENCKFNQMLNFGGSYTHPVSPIRAQFVTQGYTCGVLPYHRLQCLKVLGYRGAKYYIYQCRVYRICISERVPTNPLLKLKGRS